MDETNDAIELPRESMAQPPALLPTAPQRKAQREKSFTDAVIVRRLEGDNLLVPMSQEGVKNANIITAEMCRDLLERTIDKYKEQDKTPTTKEMGELINAAKAVAEMAKSAHEGGELGVPSPNGLAGAPGQTIQTPDQFLTLMAKITTVAPVKNVTPK